jgi:putative transposase
MGEKEIESIRRMAGLATPMALRVAVTLALPDRLAGPEISVAELATQLDVSPIALDLLLAHLATLGIVERTDSGYRTSEYGANLRSDAGNGLTDLLHLHAAGGRSELAFVELAYTVATGRPGYPQRYQVSASAPCFGMVVKADEGGPPRPERALDRAVLLDRQIGWGATECYNIRVQLRYNFCVYPTPSQQVSLAKAFGCARVVYNDALAARKRAFEVGLPRLPDSELSKRLTEAKKTPERQWLSEVSSVVLQQSLADLNAAYRNFFQSVAGKRKGAKVAPPRFRSRKDNRQSIRFTKNARFAVMPGGKLRLPKVGDVPVRWSRELPSEPSSVTIIKDASGRYFASFVVRVDESPLPPSNSEVGIDLGLSTFAVLSNGETIASPRFLRQAERKLRTAQKALSRKEKGSANRAKARVKVARAHAKVADTRRDWAHKQSTRIIGDNQAVFVEDLCVKGLARTRLAKSVHDAGWSMFIRMLEEKASRYGRTFGKVDRWFPSTRMCSACGAIGERKPLHVRFWTCVRGVTHDRDVNAAKNILAAGRADRSTPVELMSVVPSGARSAVKQEPAGSAV